MKKLMMSALLATLVTGQAFAGGREGGGGNSIVNQGCPTLLDLYLANPNTVGCSGGAVLAETKALKTLQIERLNTEDSELTREALKKVDAWRKTSPVITSYLEAALERAPLYYTTYRIGIKDKSYAIPAEFENTVTSQDLTTVAYYTKDFGILVSKKDFEKFDKRNQVALLIHEALRHVQIQYGFQMSNESIQKLTAAIVDRKPVQNESLDTPEYVDGSILGMIKGPGARAMEVQKLRSEACAVASKVKAKLDEFTNIDINDICSSNYIPLMNLSTKFRRVGSDLSEAGYYEESGILLAAARSTTTMSVDEILDRGAPAVAALSDVTQNARLAMGIDGAIDQANNEKKVERKVLKEVKRRFEVLEKNGVLNK